MRWLAPITAAVVVSAFSAGAAVGQTRSVSSVSADRAAYDLAMRCYVANVRAAGLRQRSGGEAQAEAHRASARASFEAAVRLGQALGYDNRYLNDDFRRAQDQILPRMVNDPALFQEAVSTCRTLGLMPSS